MCTYLPTLNTLKNKVSYPNPRQCICLSLCPTKKLLTCSPESVIVPVERDVQENGTLQPLSVQAAVNNPASCSEQAVSPSHLQRQRHSMMAGCLKTVNQSVKTTKLGNRQLSMFSGHWCIGSVV